MNGIQPHLIFVHIPKTAGTSLSTAIMERMGGENMHRMGDKVGAKSYLQRNLAAVAQGVRQRPLQVPIYFGHFMAGKWARFNGWEFSPRAGCIYATMLREPLQRALSHFHFWKRTDVSGHQVWERFTREKWSLERFLIAPELRNLQSRFLWRFPLHRFHVVGLAEHYAESVAMLGHVFPLLSGLPATIANANPDRPSAAAYDIHPDLATAFKRRNRKDYDLYAKAVTQFELQRIWLDGRPPSTCKI